MKLTLAGLKPYTKKKTSCLKCKHYLLQEGKCSIWKRYFTPDARACEKFEQKEESK